MNCFFHLKSIIMKRVFTAFFILAASIGMHAQVYTSQSMHVGFFSTTPVENIKADANDGIGAINTATNKVAFSVKIRSFQFPKKLMQEHFNEKYMESDKKGYEIASFVGVIQEKVDYTKDGIYKVNVKGKLKIHGVEQERTLPGTIEVKNGKLKITSNFKVRVADHKIEIPSIVTANIAEVVDVSVSGEMVKKQ
jgi:hypothetical protein